MPLAGPPPTRPTDWLSVPIAKREQSISGQHFGQPHEKLPTGLPSHRQREKPPAQSLLGPGSLAIGVPGVPSLILCLFSHRLFRLMAIEIRLALFVVFGDRLKPVFAYVAAEGTSDCFDEDEGSASFDSVPKEKERFPLFFGEVSNILNSVGCDAVGEGLVLFFSDPMNSKNSAMTSIVSLIVRPPESNASTPNTSRTTETSFSVDSNLATAPPISFSSNSADANLYSASTSIGELTMPFHAITGSIDRSFLPSQ